MILVYITANYRNLIKSKLQAKSGFEAGLHNTHYRNIVYRILTDVIVFCIIKR